MSAIPQVPPRPSRSQHQQPPIQDFPKIAPRPSRGKPERSQSPHRDQFARSPFNEPHLSKTISNSGLSVHSRNDSSTNLPARPPSVSLPSIGQEGDEYADIDYTKKPEDKDAEEEEAVTNEPRETRNVAGDLPLHAPKPSLSSSTAKTRVSTVTRTDSQQAAAVGIGKPTTPTLSPEDTLSHDHPFKPKVSFRTESAASTERPDSAAQTEDDHRIPEIGQRVPMLPDAGDVQAPSPSPFQQQFPVGIGFHNSGSAKPGRHHRRTPSGREILPPGSYGLHGHGIQNTDQFERDWYAKHPEALDREEHGEYGPGIGGGRGEWAMSSDDLNKLVYETAKKSTSKAGGPNEQIGYQASELYASRMQSPAQPAQNPLWQVHSNTSQTHVASPLRKTSFPAEPDAGAILQKTRSMDTKRRSHEVALESETETEDEGIRIGSPAYRTSKYTGGGYDPPTVDLGPRGGNTEAEGGVLEERGYGVPILASDEVAKTPGGEYMQPAVSPAQERRGSGYYTAGVEGAGEYQSGGFRMSSRPGSAANSRPSSRPGSISLSRFPTHDDDRDNMHTPLEDVDEYEPLFPEDDGTRPRRPLSVADRLKLREKMKRFPSQDIWEDTPNSLRLEAEVDTPEAVTTQSEGAQKSVAATFETAEQEAARKGEPSEEEKSKLIPAQERLAKSKFQPHIKAEMERPGLQPRFPSRDIWEDSPDSAQLEATVGSGEDRDTSPPDAGLAAGAVVQTNARPKDGIMMGDQPRENATAGAPIMDKPSIPPRPNKYKVPPPPSEAAESQAPPGIPVRPTKRQYKVPPPNAQIPSAPSDSMAISPTESRPGPLLPDRPKPQIPARPGTKAPEQTSDSTPLSKVVSASSTGSTEQAEKESGTSKTKPAVPARPTGSKIANLKAGFLGDLESRLKLGPQAPKSQEKEKAESEIEEEKAPLSDARKGRAKGPAKRKPVPTSAATTEKAAGGHKWSIHPVWTVWETDEEGSVGISSAKVTSQPGESPAFTDKTPKADDGGDLAPSDPATLREVDPTDMAKAKEAVEEAVKANDPLSQSTVMTPELADLATPGSEKERNPLSKTATNVSSHPSTAISPEPELREQSSHIKGQPPPNASPVGADVTTAVIDAQVKDDGE